MSEGSGVATNPPDKPADASAPKPPPDGYKGLHANSLKNFAIAGVILAFLNMTAVWFSVYSATIELHNDKTISKISDVFTNSIEVEKQMDIKPNRTGAAYLAMQISAQNRLLSLRHSYYVTSIGMAFAFACFGFSLFVMGYESAYSVSLSSGKDTLFSLVATSPGILCIIIAAWIISSGIAKTVELNLTPPQIVTGYPEQSQLMQEKQEITMPKEMDPKKGLLD